MKDVTLPSGALLQIGTVPFDATNNLKKAVMKEVKAIPMTSTKILIDLSKDYVCGILGSDEVEKCLWECMKRCLYNGMKIDKATFESEEARSDFTDVQMEVGQHCLLPFGKSLMLLLQLTLVQMRKNIQASG